MVRSRRLLSLVFFFSAWGLTGCGGSDTASSASSSTGGGANAGAGGTANGGSAPGGHGGTHATGGGGSGASTGASGSGGASGRSGSGGEAGAAAHGGGAGHAGASGQGGGIGGAAGVAGVGGGVGGAESVGGSAGATGGMGAKGGAAGQTTAGGAGGHAGCETNADCMASAPSTIPPNCAVGTCQPDHSCHYTAVDADGDGVPTNKCKAVDGTPITIGGDCDDEDPKTNPNAWDGPACDGHGSECDGLDEDCDGTPDDGLCKSGESCTCTPQDVQKCSSDSAGHAIVWPGGKPQGACEYGSQTCLANGTWGPCTGAIVPTIEECNGLDDDCNGTVDDGPAPDHVPVDALYYVYDGDDDDHAGMKAAGYTQIHVCPSQAPTLPPEACTGLTLPCAMGSSTDACCPTNAWKLASGIPQDDCDDRNPSVFPSAPESCSTPYDDNCNGTANEGCACVPGVPLDCHSTPSGDNITWPKGMPLGSCKSGQESCGSNGQYGPCVGAIGPLPSDNCTIAGNDDDCDGVSNGSCACLDVVGDPSYQVSCSNLPDGTPISWPTGAPAGSCSYGSKQCQSNGQYGACNGAVAPKGADRCDLEGNDDDCDGIPNEGCTCIDVTTDVTYTSQCSATPNGTTINWPGGKPQGPCKYGTEQCQSNGTYAQCLGAVVPEGADGCTVRGDDSNCDGTANGGCTCIDAPGDPTYTTNCSATAQGVAIMYPGTIPQGACKYGTQTCGTNGQYGACQGAVGPAAQDDCGGAMGIDSNCDGVVSCSCQANSTTTMGCTQLGSCAGATHTCKADGSGYGACSKLPAAADSCSPGNDDNCDGMANEGCTCVLGTTSTGVCPQQGSCANNYATCVTLGSGKAGWGPCGPFVATQDSCVAGNDDSCDGVPNEGCGTGVDGVNCGSASTCNTQATYSACQKGGVGCVCSPAPASPAVNTFCPYGGLTAGVCASGGTYQCLGGDTTSDQTTCSGKRDPNVDVGNFQTYAASWNGSYDWNCDGATTTNLCAAIAPGVCSSYVIARAPDTDAATCKSEGTSGGFNTLCAESTASNTCTSTVVAHAYVCGSTLFGTNIDCGKDWYKVTCSWNGSACVYSGGAVSGPSLVGCK